MSGPDRSASPPHAHPPEGGTDDEPGGPAGVRWAVLAAIGVLVVAAIGALMLDLDRDGLSAWDEARRGTSPWNGDTDRDGLADGFEVERELDPLAPDTDEDEVRDRSEVERGTNPREPDTDDDELEDGTEARLGTNPRTSDTDGDTVDDGREEAIGTNPRRLDTDTDGLDDGRELLLGASPWVSDTDDDGWADLHEAERGPEDCDDDGYDRVADADDDGDRLLDVEEEQAWRCEPDTDQDGILDGDEAARGCVEQTDCDVDGLADGQELGTAFDRLDPDTYDVGLLDGVSYAFQQAGQPASRDEDRDGIPDAWESNDGLLDWQHFDPEPGQRDLLVEFVRVEGPDSARLGPGSFAPAYDQVADFMAEDGSVEMDWIETRVRLDTERRPPLIPSSLEGYYGEVLRRAETSANPYVTTVVMNPQHDQQRVQHQGVAPIRGMLAAVDYGAHTDIFFESERSTLRLSPYIESLVAAGRLDLLERSGITGGGMTTDGRMVLEHEDWELVWRPFWYAEPPVQRFEDGTQLAYERDRLVLDRAELADTIAHELGHTLGLCHTNLPDCVANLSAGDRQQVGVSTMDERRRSNELALLDSEWDRLRDYLVCPPQRSITMVAEDAGREAVIDAKYEITLENVLDVGSRECLDRASIPEDLSASLDPRRYDPPYTFAAADVDDPPTTYEAPRADRVPDQAPSGAGRTIAYGVGSLIAAGLAGLAVARWRP